MHNLGSEPAVLGGDPVFGDVLPFAQPTIPQFDELVEAGREVFSSKSITNSKYVREFEDAVAAYLGVKDAVAVSSCTSGLMLVMRAMELSGEAIVPSFTFSATVQSLIWNNIRPVFADCEMGSFNINTRLIEPLITGKTSVLLAVHVFGMPADIESLSIIAKKHNLRLIFDAAHAFGSIYKGRHVGSFGDAEVFSLSPTKLLTTGEGGIIATNDGSLAGKLRIGRDYANPGDYDCQFPGLNARMPEFNAILGLKGLETIEEKVMKRNDLVDLYKANLRHLPGIDFQEESPEVRSTYKDFSVLLSPERFGLTRDELSICLDAENIRTKKYYFPPVHRQKFFTSIYGNHARELPVTEHVSQNILSLPIFSHMQKGQVVRVCEAVTRIHKYRGRIMSSLRNANEGKLLSSIAGIH